MFLPRNEYPMASIKCILAFLSQHSTPRISFGTMNRAANFSVSVSACSNTFMHFLTGSAKYDLLSEVDSDGVLENPAKDWSEALAMVVSEVVILGAIFSLAPDSSITYCSALVGETLSGVRDVGSFVSWK